MTDYLSLELCYPSCPHCATGPTGVIRQHTQWNREPWTCLNCETSFETPRDSPWYCVDKLEEELRDAYLQLEIRKADPHHLGRMGTVAELRNRASEAKSRLALHRYNSD